MVRPPFDTVFGQVHTDVESFAVVFRQKHNLQGGLPQCEALPNKEESLALGVAKVDLWKRHLGRKLRVELCRV